MQQPPAWVIASWPTPNFVDPETHGNGNIILNIVLYIILCCFISLRVWTRTRLKASFGADDMMILFAMIPTTAFFVLSLLADIKFMWTRHQYDIPQSQVEFGLKMVMLIEIMFASACTLTKLSMLMLVRRMLTSASMFWRRVTLGAIWVVGLQGLLFCIVLVFQCRPPQDYWKVTTDPQPNCIDQSSTLLFAGIVNTLTDFLVVLLPIRTVVSYFPRHSLIEPNANNINVVLNQPPRRQSLIVSFLFTLGFLSCFAGVIRTYYMYHVTKVWDQVWASYAVWVSAAVELYVGIICTSIPATKAFFVAYIPKLFNTHPSGISRASLAYPNLNSKPNAKDDPLNPSSTPGFGITSPSKSHSKSQSLSHCKGLRSQGSKTPLNAEEPDYDRTVGTSIFELSSFTTSTTRVREGIDEEMEVGFVAASPVSPESHKNGIGRSIMGSIRKGRDRDGEKVRRTGSGESRRDRSREKEDGGWDIHIDVVRTVEVEEEFEEEFEEEMKL